MTNLTSTKQPAKPALKLRFTGLRDLLTRELPPALPRIWPWLDSGESCLLWGGTGSGKSNLAMTLALGVAGGGRLLGLEFRNPCRVCYVDGEQSIRDLQSRFSFLGSAIEGHNSSAARDNLTVIARTESDSRSPFLDINCEDHARVLVRSLKAQRIEFIVFDNLSTLSASLKDENSAAEFKAMQALFAHLKGENIASVLVHHSGKANTAKAKTFRGSSNIATTFERVVAITRNDHTPPTELAVCVEIQKYRAKPPPGFCSQFHCRLETTEDTSGCSVAARWIIDEDRRELAEIWRMFWNGEFESIADFVNEVNAKFGTRYRPNNFARDFSRRWQRDLGIPEADIEKVKRCMKQPKARGFSGDEF
jgi:hypothetical protein